MNLSNAKRHLFEYLRREVGDERVIQAMERVPREMFVPAASQHLAYEDIPLPIGYGQTISQPFIVALMTKELEIKESDKVLELGTGSGYQAAVLGQLSRKVISLERIPELAQSAAALLRGMGYTNVDVKVASIDVLGCVEEAPFDAIVVTAGSPRLPRELLDQMAEGGRMVIPVGSQREQDLMKIVKHEDGYAVKSLGPCRFVPLMGKGAWDEGRRWL